MLVTTKMTFQGLSREKQETKGDNQRTNTIRVIFSLSNLLLVLHARQKAAACVTREVFKPINEKLFCFKRVKNKIHFTWKPVYVSHLQSPAKS